MSLAPPITASPAPRPAPADPILLGYVHSLWQRDWIARTRTYNLRADCRAGSVPPDSALLAAPFVLLYGPRLEGASLWTNAGPRGVVDGESLAAAGYRAPSGSRYTCLALGQRVPGPWEAVPYLDWRRVGRALLPRAAAGVPVAVDLMTLTTHLPALEGLKGG